MNGFAKGLPIGLLIGALLGFGLWKTVEARRAREAAAALAAGPQAGVTEKSSSSTEGDAGKLTAEVATLRKDRDALQARLDALKKRSGSAGGTDTDKPKGGLLARAEKNPWSGVGKKLFLLRDKLDGLNGEMDPEVQALWVELVGIVKTLAEEYGLDMSEFEINPLLVPLLMAAMLDAADTPPGAEQSAILDAIVDKALKDGQDLADGKGKGTALERRRDSILATGTSLDTIWDSLSEEQRGYFKSAQVFGRDKFGRPNDTRSGSRAEVTEQLTSTWQHSLGLDDSQKVAVQPIVEDYIRKYEEFQSDFARREAAGEKVSPTTKALAAANLMVDAQKKISESVRLSEPQQKTLKNWKTVYGVEIK